MQGDGVHVKLPWRIAGKDQSGEHTCEKRGASKGVACFIQLGESNGPNNRLAAGSCWRAEHTSSLKQMPAAVTASTSVSSAPPDPLIFANT